MYNYNIVNNHAREGSQPHTPIQKKKEKAELLLVLYKFTQAQAIYISYKI